MKENIIRHKYTISKEERKKLLNQNSFLLWFTGLSGSGKSTIANGLERKLYEEGFKTYTLDGDNVRKGINSDLDFSPEGRKENIRRIAEVAGLMVDSGIIVLAAFVSPYKKDREFIANVVGNDNFVEIFVNTSLEECEKRDVKGLYKKARAGEIKDFTGVNAPYEAPENPEVEIVTDNLSIEESVMKIYNSIRTKLAL
ncbi:adenylyl-sulfate kinase [Lutimonas saemankumensis]|uniref:adenylyl-sulfate kinase n=1 Tax=Lutimonas saemankumensis TaxID=483016 RepID=UPI001CD733B7|nr:adenylyl-sulfate kinase [Lutimonas saemankumensis]MCA0931466.1 adenylyl-sulfate kinase [Lutimonas saemankumensis]